MQLWGDFAASAAKINGSRRFSRGRTLGRGSAANGAQIQSSPFTQKGYIHVVPPTKHIVLKQILGSICGLCVSVPVQPYIVEICDSLRGKIFQKFIERWDRGVGGWERWLEQFANILLNPHFPLSPPPPQSDKFTRFCQWKNVELNIHVSTHFCVRLCACVCPLRVISIQWCAEQNKDIKGVYHFRSSCRHSCVSFHRLCFTSLSCYSLVCNPARLSASQSK